MNSHQKISSHSSLSINHPSGVIIYSATWFSYASVLTIEFQIYLFMECLFLSFSEDDAVKESLNLADLDLNKLKLSEEDALALSYLTPGLSRRLQKQLLAQLAPSEVRKLQRTLSSRTSEEERRQPRVMRQLSERTPSALSERLCSETTDSASNESNLKNPRSFLPVKRDEYRPSYEFNVRSSSIGAEPRSDSKFLSRKPKITKSLSVREPRSYSVSRSDLQSPDSSISESLESSSKCISDSSASRAYSKYSDSSFSRYSPSRYDSNQLLACDPAETKKPNTKRVSRFLRPDFFDAPKEESTYLKEKKEREMETQKVLKEIRDKRRSRLRHERSQSREKQLEKDDSEKDFYRKKEDIVKEADKLLTNVCNSIKTLENNMKSSGLHDYVNMPVHSADKSTSEIKSSSESSAKVLHDYVNVKGKDADCGSIKKEKVSRIARPKSYPSDSVQEAEKKISPDKESKLSKLRKGFSKQASKTKEDKNLENKTINQEDKGQKNKLLQSIEKKLEKFRSSSPKDSKVAQEKKSSVESAIKQLREQSLPRNMEHCTESGLIKRAVSVEDMSGAKPLQASRKSVTKILGLFKKYEEQENKRKVVKKPKSKEKKGDTKQDESVSNNPATDATEEPPNESSQSEKKERPRSLLFDKVKQFQNTYNGAKSDTVLDSVKETKSKSKLPVNSYRRSLNLDSMAEPPKFYKNPSKTNEEESEKKVERRNLKLDLNKTVEPNRNSATTDDSSTVLSPSDDYLSCDSWSVCSDLHRANDLQSPLSPNGHIYSGDENESVIDRIRRKSFYTRFNEKKCTRRPTISYKDLDLGYKSPASSSLDYRSLDRYRNPLSKRGSYAPSSTQEPSNSYRSYGRSASVMNDYVNVPNRYQTYSSKIGRPASSIYSDPEDNSLDDLLSTAKSRK